jgi:hypothetical protein
MEFGGGEYYLVQQCHRSRPISHFCPDWDKALPRDKVSEHGQVLKALKGDNLVESLYDVVWQPLALTETVSIDELLGEFSTFFRK